MWVISNMQWYLAIDLPPFELGNDHDWTKGLLFSYVHVVLHVSEHSGLKEETWKETWEHSIAKLQSSQV